MDPLTSLIGPVIGGALSFFGGQENRSSAQAINAANLQQQLNMAQGSYLPGLVRNAEHAGINPLAVLGMHAPAGGSAVPIGAGEGLERAGDIISKIDPRKDEIDTAAVEKAKADAATSRATAVNVQMEAARNRIAVQRLIEHPDLMPAGVSEPAKDTNILSSSTQAIGEFLRNHKPPSWDTWTSGIRAPAPPAVGEPLGPSFLDRFSSGVWR